MPISLPRIRVCRLLSDNGTWRIWHARRNTDMLAGLILRYVLRRRLLLVFTSAAQRHHSWITRFYMRHMDAVVAPTAAAASYLDRPSIVVPHGVDVSRFSPPVDRDGHWRRTGLPGRFGIGVFGRIRPQKGTEDFVDAMLEVLPQRPDWTAVLVGQTTQEYAVFRRRLIEKIEQAGLGPRLRFVGFLKGPDQIPDWYRAMKVVVCPSRIEGFGLPCLEAMASGCPVVATDTGAWPEIIEDGLDGYLVPCGDVKAMADAILRITQDPSRAQAMGARARDKVVARYQIGQEAQGIYQVYRQLLDRTGRSG